MKKNPYKQGKCKWCGNKFTPETPNHKYCSRKCRKNARKEIVRKLTKKYREKYIPNYIHPGLGMLGPHREKSFKKEYRKIRKEIKRIGLRK